jgi:hypothetical protein
VVDDEVFELTFGPYRDAPGNGTKHDLQHLAGHVVEPDPSHVGVEVDDLLDEAHVPGLGPVDHPPPDDRSELIAVHEAFEKEHARP